jgi:hypothetical protein
MRYSRLGLFGCALACCGWAMPAAAQSGADLPTGEVPRAVVPAPSAPKAPGPKIFIADARGQLATIDSGNGAIAIRGFMKEGAATRVLDDIAFCPDGTLFGIRRNTPRALYAINPNSTPPALTSRGLHNIQELNALVCNADGVLLAHTAGAARLYRLDKATARATLIGATGAERSDGDLVHHENGLFLATLDAQLAKLNKATGAVLSVKSHNLNDMFGLASLGTNQLYGFAGTRMYRFTENAAGPTGATTVRFDFTGKGLVRINGASFNGNFQR